MVAPRISLPSVSLPRCPLSAIVLVHPSRPHTRFVLPFPIASSHDSHREFSSNACLSPPSSSHFSSKTHASQRRVTRNRTPVCVFRLERSVNARVPTNQASRHGASGSGAAARQQRHVRLFARQNGGREGKKRVKVSPRTDAAADRRVSEARYAQYGASTAASSVLLLLLLLSLSRGSIRCGDDWPRSRHDRHGRAIVGGKRFRFRCASKISRSRDRGEGLRKKGRRAWRSPDEGRRCLLVGLYHLCPYRLPARPVEETVGAR